MSRSRWLIWCAETDIRLDVRGGGNRIIRRLVTCVRQMTETKQIRGKKIERALEYEFEFLNVKYFLIYTVFTKCFDRGHQMKQKSIKFN